MLPLGTTSKRNPLFPVELHIRTGEMHRLAEYGIAGTAHHACTETILPIMHTMAEYGIAGISDHARTITISLSCTAWQSIALQVQHMMHADVCIKRAH